MVNQGWKEWLTLLPWTFSKILSFKKYFIAVNPLKSVYLLNSFYGNKTKCRCSGNNGEKIVEEDIPENLMDEALVARKTMLDAASAFDEIHRQLQIARGVSRFP